MVTLPVFKHVQHLLTRPLYKVHAFTGKINRGKLGDLVFEDHAARKKLTAATHLPIALELFRQLAVEWLSLTNLIVSRRT